MNTNGSDNGSIVIPDFHRPHAHSEPTRFAPYKRLHRKLRGRYPFVIPLVVIAMGAGGYLGWHRSVPVYRSEGLVHVANSLPMVLNQTDQNENMQMYEEFVDSQVLLMGSRQVVLSAMADPQFQAALGKRQMSEEQFVADLTTDHPPRTEAIDVTFTDPDPFIAAQAVKAVIGAFVDSYGRSDDTEEGRRLDVLHQRKQSLETEIENLRKQIAAVPAPDALSIAMVDENMRQMLAERDALKDDPRLNMGAARPDAIASQRRLAELDAQIDKYRTEFTAMQAATAAGPATERKVTTLPEFLAFEEKMDTLRADLDETVRRIDVLTTEASLHTGRFSIAADGDIPSAPYADRRARMAAVFALAAGMVPIAFFGLLGILDRRFHYSEDALESLDIPLLGVLPVLPDQPGHDAELARIASYCIHKLRVRLQMLTRKQERTVIMVTSASAGEGKTSLTLALGMAFAATGKNTLLIDADPVARGLTRRLDKEAELGLLDAFDGPGLTLAQPVITNLSLLAAGAGDERRLHTGFGWEELDWLLRESPERYDIILLDTGPVLSSLQAPVVAQVADHVILTVSSGMQESLTRRSMRFFRSIDINVAGFVFNRANARDYNNWIGGDSYYNSVASPMPLKRKNGAPTYGPLAGSINPAKPVHAGREI
jgi:Mrp family chromosome partitioning ATPase